MAYKLITTGKPLITLANKEEDWSCKMRGDLKGCKRIVHPTYFLSHETMVSFKSVDTELIFLETGEIIHHYGDLPNVLSTVSDTWLPWGTFLKYFPKALINSDTTLIPIEPGSKVSRRFNSQYVPIHLNSIRRTLKAMDLPVPVELTVADAHTRTDAEWVKLLGLK